MPRFVTITLVLSFLLVALVPLQAADEAKTKKVNIALLDFTANNTTKANAAIIRNKIEVALDATKTFTLVERRNIDLILKEQGFQQTGCTDQECAVQLGKLLSAQYVAVGTVDKLAGYTVTLKIVSVGEGSVKFAHSESAATEADLPVAIHALAERASRAFGGSFFSMRDKKKGHFITNFIVAPPLGKMASRMDMGWGGSIGMQYRDYVVIGIEGAAMQFNSKAVKGGYYITMPLYATLGVNLKLKDFVAIIPYVSGGFAWIWWKGIPTTPLNAVIMNGIKKDSLKNEFKGVMKTGLVVEIQPGSVVSLSVGGYYALIFKNTDHSVEYAHAGVTAGLNFRF